jgi:putative glutamine transport system substrate-binding protein
MRRCAILVLSVALTVATLVGCDGGPTPSSQIPASPTPSPFPEGISTPARIIARGYLVIGVRYDLSPFGFVTAEGQIAGFDVELGRELARRWLGDSAAVRFRQVRSDTAVQHLRSRDVDLVLATLTHTQPREGEVDFGPPVFIDGQALLVRATDALTITAPSALQGLPVGVVAGAEAADALAAAVEFTPTLQTYPSFDRALEALAAGEVQAVADLRRRLVRGLGTLPGASVVGQYTWAAVAPAFLSDEPGLADLVALTLQGMFADGSYEELYRRWFPGDAVPLAEVWSGTALLTLEEAVAVRRSDTVQAIQDRGRLLVAMVGGRSPFAYLDDAGDPAGYEVHLVRMMADRWLGDRTAVEFLPTTLDEGLRMVAAGEADLLVGAVPHSREAERQVDFSLTTYLGGESLMVQAGAYLGGIAGLDGQAVAIVAGTDSAEVVRAAARDAGFSVVVFPQATLEAAMASLTAGEVVAVVGDRSELLGPAYDTPGVGLTADRLTRVPVALVLPPGDSTFRDLVNLTLQAMAGEGLFAAVYGEWFDDEPPQMEPWPGEPTSPLRIEVGIPPADTSP